MAATKKKPVVKKKPAARAKPTKPVKLMKPAPVAVIAKPPPAPVAPPAPPPVDHAARIGDAWRRLEGFVATIDGPALGLAPGATDKSIAAAEKTMKLAFPSDFRASLRQHDGQAPAARAFPWLPGCPPLYPLATIVERWTELQRLAEKHAPKKPSKDPIDPASKLKPGLYRTGRIPIADGTFLDLDPGPSGVIGQLLTQLGKTDVVVIDASFGAAVERWASALERGIWAYDRDRHVVFPRAAPAFLGNPAGLFSKR